MTAKDEFIAIFTENVNRHGAKELLDWLLTTDFSMHLPAQSFIVPVKTDL